MYEGIFSHSMFSNVILFSPSLIVRDIDTDSENVSLIRLLHMYQMAKKGCIIDSICAFVG